MEQMAARGMRMAYWTYVLGAVLMHFVAPSALPRMGSGIDWVAPSLWLLLVVTYFVERFGAMHLQLYSTTNDIRWHVASGISGSLSLLVSLIALPHADVYAFPVGILVGNLAFYAWYGPWKVKTSFDFDFWRLQRSTVMLPACCLAALCSLDFLVLAWGLSPA